MVAEVAELEQARAILDMEIDRAKRSGAGMPAAVKVGVMLEVPALLWQLPALLRRLDFLSVGTNDLVQFLFACDRGNPRLAERYDSLSPAVLGLLRQLSSTCAEYGVPISLCGEMAGDPLDAMALIGIGFRTLSMAPASIGPVKTMIRSVHLGPLEQFMTGLLDRPDHSLRPYLRAFAQDHGIVV